MDLERSTPTPADLPAVAEFLASWQRDPWSGHLHPGDLGWHCTAGVDQTAADLRVWSVDGEPVVIGLLDGSEVLRLAVDPERAGHRMLAALVATDLDSSPLFPCASAIVEARGATALREALADRGWVDDEPWTPMTLALEGLDLTRLATSGLQVERTGVEDADRWITVHWSAFRGTPFDDVARERSLPRLRRMLAGPVADRATALLGRDAHGEAVAVICVWSAGPGRPGLVEPMGVHRGHHGKGYGVAITLAGARALLEQGASSAVVVAENSNPAALATYRSAGFRPLGVVTDMRRPG